MQGAEDILSGGISGLSVAGHEVICGIHRRPASHHAQPAARLRGEKPVSFMDLQDLRELANFFERRVAYQVAVAGGVSFSSAF